MDYTCLAVTCAEDYRELMIAELADAGFDTFMETEAGFEAYTETLKFDTDTTLGILERYQAETPVTYSYTRIEKKNWNEEWEKSYEPINVENKCIIRAEFHQVNQRFPYEIIITPKMSFGTGHHQTTYLMIKNQMNIDHAGKRVMDAGCGTAILSIMASKLGASTVEAFDIDEWSVINGNENIENNHCANINIQRGKINEVSLEGKFDIILANINKNVLLDEMKIYSGFLQEGGVLLLSGFYVGDIDDLLNEAIKLNLAEASRDEREDWACLNLLKLPRH